MFCPYCHKKTNGKADPDYLVSLFGGEPEDGLGFHIRTNLKLICDQCGKFWFVRIEKGLAC